MNFRTKRVGSVALKFGLNFNKGTSMTVYFQGFYKWHGFVNPYDSYFSDYLNMSNGNQVYALTYEGHNDIGATVAIHCYCDHHEGRWKKVFVFYRSPAKRSYSSRLTLCGSRTETGGDRHRGIIIESVIHNDDLSDMIIPRNTIKLDKMRSESLAVELGMYELLKRILGISSKEVFKIDDISEDLFKEYKIPRIEDAKSFDEYLKEWGLPLLEEPGRLVTKIQSS